MTDPAVESQRQMQLTFQDKSTDSKLAIEVTREAWLNEVKSQIEADQGVNLEAPVTASELFDEDTQMPVQQEILAAHVEHDVEAEPPAATVHANEAAIEIHETLAPVEKALEPGHMIPSVTHSVLPVLDFDLEAEPEEMDFSAEPLPEPMGLASEKVVTNLGSLTLPAALCDDELLAELSSIPEKMGFKIGEVAEMLGIKQYVLRYWETEFDVLKPKKAANNQRYYTKKDVENVYLIRKLLHRDRFSIEGARAALRDLKHVVKKEKDWSQVNHKVEAMHERVDHLITDLRKLRQLFAD